MLDIRTVYAKLLCLSTSERKNFSVLGREIGKSGEVIARYLAGLADSNEMLEKTSRLLFEHSRLLYVAGDSTAIAKLYAKKIEGVDKVYDSAKKSAVIGYNQYVASIGNGKFTVPFFTDHVEKKDSKFTENHQANLMYASLSRAHEMFPNANIIGVFDALFATIETLFWALKNRFKVVMRFHSNRVVEYQGKSQKISEIKDLDISRGQRKIRTIKVVWHGLPLYITAWRRTDKNGNRTIVYLVATFKDKPKNYVKQYKMRWKIEKLFRTCKQKLGLKDCLSMKKNLQLKHVRECLLAYTHAVLIQRKYHLKSPEEALRRINKQNLNLPPSFNTIKLDLLRGHA